MEQSLDTPENMVGLREVQALLDDADVTVLTQEVTMAGKSATTSAASALSEGSNNPLDK